MSVDVEPGTSTMSSTPTEDWSSSWTSGTQSRTNTTTSTMTSSASAVPSGLPCGITPSGITPPGIPPRPPQNVRFSGTALKSQPKPLTDTADTSDLKVLSEPLPSTKTLPSTMRFSVVRTVPLRTTTASSETEAESETTEGGVRPNTSEIAGRARNEDDSRGTMAPNGAAQWEEEEKAAEKSEARAEKTFARDPSVRQLNARAFMSAEML
ncbi:merozoite surface protein 2-like [Dermacentor albipictus]|uniref:merozoite surface protein 2-like n=1 Tax=Dermacentor albipictus TaxID=60249 RepID=UPI0031FBC4A3